MKQWIMILAAVAGLAVLVPMAFSASPRDPLARRVAALERQMKALQKSDRELKAALADTLLFSACDAAITADAFQGTWQTIDLLSSATQSGKTYFGPQIPVDATIAGHDACEARVIRSQPVPRRPMPSVLCWGRCPRRRDRSGGGRPTAAHGAELRLPRHTRPGVGSACDPFP